MYEFFAKLYYSLNQEQINLMFKLIDAVRHSEKLKDVTEKEFESLFNAIHGLVRESVSTFYDESISSLRMLIVYLMKNSVGDTVTISEDQFSTSGSYSHDIKIERLSEDDVKVSLIGLN